MMLNWSCISTPLISLALIITYSYQIWLLVVYHLLLCCRFLHSFLAEDTARIIFPENVVIRLTKGILSFTFRFFWRRRGRNRRILGATIKTIVTDCDQSLLR